MRKALRFRFIRTIAVLLVLAGLLLFARMWLADHPQYNPLAPLDLRRPRGWATQLKLDALHGNPEQCRLALERSGISFAAFPAAGEGECRREDRLLLDDALLTPAGVQFTCPVAAGMALWLAHDLQQIAEVELGTRVEQIEHLGSYNCRRIGGGEEGSWSEHATGNALDIAAFVLADGRRISVLRDWDGEGDEARFLHRARDTACASFGTVLSPDYNAAHADHLHLDQGRPAAFGFCR